MVSFQPTKPTYIADPYPALAKLRSQEPLHRSLEMNSWVLTSYQLCDQVLHDDAFSSDPVHAAGGLGASVASIRAAVPLGHAPILGNSDPPDHTRLRAIVVRAFTPRAMDAIRPVIESSARDLLAAADEEFDVMSGLSEPLVVRSVLRHLGIPEADQPAFREAGLGIMRARSDGPRYGEAALAAQRRLGSLLQKWSADGVAPETVLGTLLAAAKEGERITSDEMLMLLIHISTAGNGPTAYALGNAALVLSTRPEVQERLRDEPQAIVSTVEECLRFDSPTQVVTRFAVEESTLSGRTIRPGDALYVVIAGANRDPSRFPKPDEFQPARTDNRHLSFGMAAHFCLGAPLARVILQAAVLALVERGRFQQVAMERGGTFFLRGPKRLVLGKA